MKIKKVALLLLILLSLSPKFIFSNSNKIEKEINWRDYDGNRIAISFDGNSEPDYEHENNSKPGIVWPIGDLDEWGATAASCAIIAKLGIQERLVHCSYNNFI
ncbi:MAG: hypothetical protein R3Y50_03260, partial [Rikenellaceae bacterium]